MEQQGLTGEPREALRRLAGRQFDEACHLTRLANVELARYLARTIERPTLARQTVSKWRAGELATPYEAVIAVCLLLDVKAIQYLADRVIGEIEELRAS